MLNKRVAILLLVMILVFLVFSPSAHSEQTINRGQVVSDAIPSAPPPLYGYKVYNLSEQLPKACIFTMYFKVNVGSYGTVSLQRATETVFQWTVGTGVQSVLAIYPMYYTAFISRKGSYTLNVTNQGFGESLNYTFFYDFSDELEANNSKTIPLEEGIASYYVDLSSGDKVSLNLTSPSGADFDMQVFYGYSYLMLSPAVASTVSENLSKSLSFKAASEGRYFIFITATTGNGTFNLQSSTAPPSPTYEELQSNYNLLNSSYENLRGYYDNLQASYNSLQADLGNVRNIMYVLIAITVVSVVTNVYLLTRKPSVKAEIKAQ